MRPQRLSNRHLQKIPHQTRVSFSFDARGAGCVGWTDDHSYDLCYSKAVPLNEENDPNPVQQFLSLHLGADNYASTR